MNCNKCSGAGWYMSDPVECRDGKRRRTKLKCECTFPVKSDELLDELRTLRALSLTLEARAERGDTFRRRARIVIDKLEQQLNITRRALELLILLADKEHGPARLDPRTAQQLRAQYIDAMRSVQNEHLLADVWSSPADGLFDD